MSKERDKVADLIIAKSQCYIDNCVNNIATENGKIEGANYMLHRIIEVLREEGENINAQEKT